MSHSDKTYSIKQIFRENWADFVSHNQDVTPHVISTVGKMLSCRDPEKLGYHKYICPEHPDQVLVIPNSCKSSFCNSCGKILTDKFVAKVQSNFPPVPFHHICFTLPDSLRVLLDKNRFLLHTLFKASSQTVLSYYKQQDCLPLVISAMHSFGRPTNWNPHIHMLISSGGLLLNKDGLPDEKWKALSFIPFVMLQKRYKVILIRILKEKITSYLKSNKENVSKEFSLFSDPNVLNDFFDPLLKINWYVHDSEDLPPDKFTVTYLCRYAKRPPLAESRILSYGKNPQIDPSNPEQVWVTFHYISRTEGKLTRTVKVQDFVKLLVQHILPENFRMVRYYGVLSNRTRGKLLNVVFKLFGKQNKFVKFQTWRERVLANTGNDPLLCPVCQKQMQLVEVAYFSPTLNSLEHYYPT